MFDLIITTTPVCPGQGACQQTAKQDRIGGFETEKKCKRMGEDWATLHEAPDVKIQYRCQPNKAPEEDRR